MLISGRGIILCELGNAGEKGGFQAAYQCTALSEMPEQGQKVHELSLVRGSFDRLNFVWSRWMGKGSDHILSEPPNNASEM